MPVRWLATYEDAGEIVFRIGRAEDQLIAEWIGVACLTASRDGSRFALDVVPGSDPREVEKIERGSARLLLRHAAGHLAFHGSAVGVDGRVRVLLGRSGQGKSTLAAWLCAHGATLFADDAVAIDPVTVSVAAAPSWSVQAAEVHHWLDEEARQAVGLLAPSEEESAGKLPMRSPRPGSGSAPLAAFVELVFAEIAAPRLVRLHGVDALAALVPQAVRFVLDEPALYRRELDQLSELVQHVDVFRLERPRDLAHLDSAGALVQHLSRDTNATNATKDGER